MKAKRLVIPFERSGSMHTSGLILAIESSCDDTSAAVLRDGVVLSNIISSQAFHTTWGGVIPELASRAHLENVAPVVSAALSEAGVSFMDLQAIACTTQPGLTGALLVGSNYAKGLALRFALPCVPINHIEGHLYSAFLEDSSLEFPFVALVVSGGHTSLFLVKSFSDYIVVGSTRDDAAGEAFDKTAKLMGLGYPGGASIDRRSKGLNPDAIHFPRSLMNEDNYEFSFSGMKTAVRTFLQSVDGELDDSLRNQMCCSIQEAIVDVLVHKSVRATREFGVKHLVVAGGVSANSRLRERLHHEAECHAFGFIAPRMSYSLDNAAMIGYLAHQKVCEKGAESFRRLDFEVSSQALRMHRHGSAV